MWPESDIRVHLLARCIHCTKIKNFPVKRVKKCWAINIFSNTSSLTLHLWPCNLKINRVIYSLGASTVLSLTTSKQRGQKILIRKHFFKGQQFNLDLWPCDFKVNRGHLLPRGIWQLSSKGIKRYWVDNIFSKTNDLTLTFDHVTSKSIGVIYCFGASNVPSLTTFKQRGQKILCGHRLV